ncbi:MAG: mechanosensitive ion channel [Oscillospiraceae bacterium]|nr:mechanosensitive ion channel [Oscillospiraceae bacterium]
MKFFETLSEIKIGSISLSSILSALIVFMVCCIVIRILKKALSRMLDRSHIDPSLKSFLGSVLAAALWVVAVIIIADSLGIPVTSLVAVLSVAGLALSLAIQGLLTNLFSGVTVLITRPFVVGDFVDIGGNTGTVRSIGLFYTVLCTVDNRLIHVPNGDVTSAKLVNYSTEPLRRVDIAITASYDCSTESVRSSLLEAAANTEKALAEPAPFAAITSYGASSIEYTFRVWCKTADYWDVYFALNANIRSSFDAHGVQMTYDHLNIHIVEK